MAKKLTEVASRLASRGTSERQIIYIVDFENIPKTDVAALLRKKHVVMVVLAANRTNTVTPETLKTIEANPDRVDVIIGRITRKEFVDKLVTAKIGEYAFRFPEAEIIVLANDKDYADLAVHLNDHWEREVPIVHEAPGAKRGRRRSAASTKAKTRGAAGKAAGSSPSERTSEKGRGAKGRDSQVSAEKPKKQRAQAGAKKQTPAAAKKQTPAAAKKETPAAAKKETTAPTKSSGRRRASSDQAKVSKPSEPGRQAITNPDAEAVRGLLANVPKRRLPRSESALLNAVRNYRESVGLRSRPSTIVKHLQDCGVLDLSVSPIRYNLGA